MASAETTSWGLKPINAAKFKAMGLCEVLELPHVPLSDLVTHYQQPLISSPSGLAPGVRLVDLPWFYPYMPFFDYPVPTDLERFS